MQRRHLATLMCLVLVSLGFSGCAAPGPDGPGAGTGLGAIAGLLVDDRFRPIQLVDAVQSEFQAIGFVLLQETGAQAQTNENGEFEFTGLAPGWYTIRVTATGHEASPHSVEVRAGQFAETSIVARRTASTSSTILTQEFSVFTACEVTLVAYGTAIPCTGDQSGDTDRSFFIADYTPYPTATYLVTEFKANQDGFYEIRLTPESENCAENFAIEEIVDGDYVKIVNQRGVPRLENPLTCGNLPWDNDRPFTTIMYIDGLGKGAVPVFGGFGAGVFVAIRATFLQSVFLNEPDTDLESYCVLC